LILLWPPSVETVPDPNSGERALATVTAITVLTCAPGRKASPPCGTAAVEITDGPGRGTRKTVDLPHGPGAPRVEAGDDVVLLYYPGAVPGGREYSVVDQQRSGGMWILVALAVAVVIAFGRWRGLTSLAGLAVSFLALVLFVLPAILDGSPPLLVAVVGASAIMFAALYLTHGFSVHVSVAVAGTLASLVLTGLLGAGFSTLLKLTGAGTDDSTYLTVVRDDIDLRGLLLAGIVIGALGVLDDVTVTQAVTVAEMAPGSPSRRSLFASAIRVGRAHVGSAVNTLVLAYAGASLPLLLLIAASSQPTGELLTGEFLAQEVLRSAVGTIGLVAAVPITTALATLIADRSAVVRTGHGRHARH
ncbi:YibE/F family protein, partial [Actinoplanes sp. NPDC051633]|uniref:YibE/F family protein n=1 Tax=Actinoplanes sp. NPDC051633 TaxID=3155670 RepID=UPI00341B01A8